MNNKLFDKIKNCFQQDKKKLITISSIIVGVIVIIALAVNFIPRITSKSHANSNDSYVASNNDTQNNNENISNNDNNDIKQDNNSNNNENNNNSEITEDSNLDDTTNNESTTTDVRSNKDNYDYNSTNTGNISNSNASSTSVDKEDINITLNQNGGWQENEKFGYVHEIVITNSSQKTINDWTLKLNYPGQLEIKEFWCGNYTQNNNELSITPADYNKTIQSGGVITIGFKCYSESELVAEQVSIDSNVTTSITTADISE